MKPKTRSQPKAIAEILPKSFQESTAGNGRTK